MQDLLVFTKGATDMITLIKNLCVFEQILLFITVGYGIVFGVRNMVLRVIATLGFGRYSQSELGGLLDVLFCSSIAYFLFVWSTL